LRELVIHYEPGAKETVSTTYQQFIGDLPPSVTVYAVCPDPPAFQELKTILGAIRCQLRPVIVNHPITAWARDRWVCLRAPGANTATLLTPRAEAAEEIWPARAGDKLVAEDLSKLTETQTQARRSDLYFDGGDFMADNQTAFIVGRVAQRNIEHTVRSRADLLNAAYTTLNRPILYLTPAPDHHAGMFMAVVGNRTVLVGDPRLGAQYLPPTDGQNKTLEIPGGPDLTPQTQALFDAVATQIAQTGYTVHRIPVVLSPDGRTYLTYCNVLIDQRDGHRIVYLPFYRGADALNTAAKQIWENLGYETRPIDCTGPYRHFGCLHCLVNVLRRD
jgi:hypothetical protein